VSCTGTLPSKDALVQLQSHELAHVLRVWPVARLATVGAAGAPRVVPIVFAAVDGVLYSPIDGKPKRSVELQRIRNVARNPAVSVVLDRYDADWRQLWWVRIDATAGVITAATIEPLVWERVVGALRAKYPQYATVAMFADAPTLLRITPLRHAAWSAQPLRWEALA
jgi:PPOX class probable F420-dependent enzyme